MNADFFKNNRQKLLDATNADYIVIAGNTAVQRSNDASYAFEQDANFWYLAGIDAADWWLIIEPKRSLLVAPDIDETHRVFDGDLSWDDAIKMSGVDMVLSFEEGEMYLSAHPDATVYTIGDDPHEDHYDFSLNPGPVEMYEELKDAWGKVKDCRHKLAKLRAIKQPEEIAAMRQAINLTIDAFNIVKEKFATYEHEYEIEADFSHTFRTRGAKGHAYDPIVAAGAHACTLHYGKNQSALQKGQLVLMDIGARHAGYAADITRTYVYGDMTDRQKQVHAEVEKAHKEIIALLRPDLELKTYMNLVDDIMKRALMNLDLYHDQSDYRKYFPHSISHGLGIDVHDALGGPATLQPGMVLTVEPGIYIPKEGIGVRIEDDILITETGHENLSEKLPTSL